MSLINEIMQLDKREVPEHNLTVNTFVYGNQATISLHGKEGAITYEYVNPNAPYPSFDIGIHSRKPLRKEHKPIEQDGMCHTLNEPVCYFDEYRVDIGPRAMKEDVNNYIGKPGMFYVLIETYMLPAYLETFRK